LGILGRPVRRIRLRSIPFPPGPLKAAYRVRKDFCFAFWALTRYISETFGWKGALSPLLWLIFGNPERKLHGPEISVAQFGSGSVAAALRYKEDDRVRLGTLRSRISHHRLYAFEHAKEQAKKRLILQAAQSLPISVSKFTGNVRNRVFSTIRLTLEVKSSNVPPLNQAGAPSLLRLDSVSRLNKEEGPP
jgi:hypothetical protein